MTAASATPMRSSSTMMASEQARQTPGPWSGRQRASEPEEYDRIMRVDSNFFSTVPIPGPGDPAIAPTPRRFGNAAVIDCYKNLVEWARTADELGFDTMWLTEHHFQHE